MVHPLAVDMGIEDFTLVLVGRPTRCTKYADSDRSSAMIYPLMDLNIYLVRKYGKRDH